MTVILRVVLTCLVRHYLFRIVLDVVALELDELVEPKFAQSLSSSRVLPSNPRQILFLISNVLIDIIVANLLVLDSRSD